MSNAQQIEFHSRRVWPFKDMDVNDVIVIERKGGVQAYVHTYGNAVGKKFITQKVEDGKLAVKRVL